MQALLDFSNTLHERCLSLGPDSEYQEIYQAIVCGSNLKSAKFLRVFKTSGLMHIIVVSGSHLIFLSDFLSRLKIRSKLLHTILLAAYVCVCQVQPPALRSFVVFLLNQISNHYALHMPAFYKHLFSTFICLGLFPHWSNSLSLKLSLLASIGLALARGHIKQSVMVFLLLMPMLSFVGFNIISLINNILFSQVIGAILFPLSLVSMLIPPIIMLSDWVWWLSLYMLDSMNRLFLIGPQSSIAFPKDNLMHWMYICFALAFTRKRSSTP